MTLVQHDSSTSATVHRHESALRAKVKKNKEKLNWSDPQTN
jgi:hypothetical protein